MSNENKKIEDYLHLYVGCFAKTVMTEHEIITGKIVDLVRGGFYHAKPILRPLSDMTMEEVEHCWNLLNWNKGAMSKEKLLDEIYDDPAPPQKHYDGIGFLTMLAILPYLLKQGFDLFGLIESGLAIDKTTLNVTPS